MEAITALRRRGLALRRRSLLASARPWRSLAYLVTSVRQGTVDDHRLFVWSESERRYVQAPLVIGP